MTPTEAQSAWSRMSPEERLAMAKACPRIVKRWGGGIGRTPSGMGMVYSRNFSNGDRACEVMQAGKFIVRWRGEPGDSFLIRGDFPTLAEAQSACDAELIRQGYVLENEL